MWAKFELIYQSILHCFCTTSYLAMRKHSNVKEFDAIKSLHMFCFSHDKKKYNNLILKNF